jgi:hypothetical protein
MDTIEVNRRASEVSTPRGRANLAPCFDLGRPTCKGRNKSLASKKNLPSATTSSITNWAMAMRTNTLALVIPVVSYNARICGPPPTSYPRTEKGVMLSHRNLIEPVRLLSEMENISSRSRLLHFASCALMFTCWTFSVPCSTVRYGYLFQIIW